MSKAQKLWAIGVAVFLFNSFVAACCSFRYNPLDLLSYSVNNPSFLGPLLVGGSVSYVIFAAVTAVFTVMRRSYREKPAAWSNFLLISTALHLGFWFLTVWGSSEEDRVARLAPDGMGLASTMPPSEAVARPVGVRQLTENDLRAMADARNKTLPMRTSANLELTRVDQGPGMQVTYQVRVLAEGIQRANFSDAEIASLRGDGIKEGCVEFRAGLQSGVTFVMAYNASDGTNLFRFPIVAADC